jgi:hypothetical protein
MPCVTQPLLAAEEKVHTRSSPERPADRSHRARREPHGQEARMLPHSR